MGRSLISFELSVLNTVLTGPQSMGLVVLTNPGGRSDWAWAMVLIRQNNDATVYRLIISGSFKNLFIENIITEMDL
jgi:hypothetical protein